LVLRTADGERGAGCKRRFPVQAGDQLSTGQRPRVLGLQNVSVWRCDCTEQGDGQPEGQGKKSHVL
jgi:hypothetical protein